MPSKKQPSKAAAPSWQVILEEMRSQNRATIEAVEASRTAIEKRIDRLAHDTSTRDAAMEMAIRELRIDVRQLQGNVSQLQGNVSQLQGDVRQLQGDVRGLAGKVDALAHLDERVTALEKRLAS